MIEINKIELYELLSKVFDEGKTSYQDLKHDYIQNIVDNLESQIKQRLVQLESINIPDIPPFSSISF